MTVSKQLTVFCNGSEGPADEDFCGMWIYVEALTDPGARREAARGGWTRQGDKDYCPDCTKKRTALAGRNMDATQSDS